MQGACYGKEASYKELVTYIVLLVDVGRDFLEDSRDLGSSVVVNDAQHARRDRNIQLRHAQHLLLNVEDLSETTHRIAS